MRVKFKLFATLTDYLPQPSKSNQVELDVPDGTTVDAVVADWRLPQHLVHLVLINGNYVAPEARGTTPLKDGDTLAIWPPVAGG